jgi:hypothetical protein
MSLTGSRAWRRQVKAGRHVGGFVGDDAASADDHFVRRKTFKL